MNKSRFLPRRHKDNPVIREYEQAVKRGDRLLQNSYHVVRHDDGWAVKKAGTERGRVFETQAKAINMGKQTAKRERTELFIHGRDGRIRERNSFGADPFPPRG